jgi:hypothetical protein
VHIRNDFSPDETGIAKHKKPHVILLERPISPPQQGHKIFCLPFGASKGVMHLLQKK